MRRLPALLAILLSAVSAVSLGATPSPRADQGCVPPPVGKLPFSIGERIDYELDSLGINVGEFNLTVAPARRPNVVTILAHGKTGSVTANFVPLDATAEAYLGRGLETHRYVEDAVNGNVHRSLDATFPSGSARTLAVHATKEGSREDFATPFVPGTRDMLGALYAVRAMDLKDNVSFCLPIFGAKKVWLLRAKVVGHDSIRTPGGDFRTIHLAGTATRVDTTNQPRNVELWLSDDASRIPVAALGMFQNKVLRAQLADYKPGKKQPARGSRP